MMGRRSALPTMLAAVALCVGLQIAGTAAAVETLTLSTLTNDFYPAPRSLTTGYMSSGYGWDMVSEPERDMKISVEDANPDAVYRWTFSEDGVSNEDNSALDWSIAGTPTIWVDGQDEAESAIAIADDGTATILATTGASVHMRSTRGHAGSAWWLKVEELDATTNQLQKEITSQIVVKYVRREVRQLADDDRELFLDALDIIYSLSSTEGKVKYGQGWQNYEDFSLTHVGYNYQTSCTPYHEGTVFFDAHQAFFYTLERSLQLIDPSIAVAYWDYIRDTQELGTEWYKSPAVALFGTPDTTGTLAGDGRFSYVEIPVLEGSGEDDDQIGEITNIFNLLEAGCSINDSPYAQRFSAQGVCGMTTQQLPGCSELMGAFDSTSLDNFDDRLEADVHAPIHLILGGATDCDEDMGALQAKYPQFAEMWNYLSSWSYTFWQSVYVSGLIEHPDGCSSTSAFEECRWQSSELESRQDADGLLDWANAFELESTMWTAIAEMVMELDGDSSSSDSVDDDTISNETTYRFPGVTADENSELLTAITSFALLPPRMGHLSTGNTADPLFPVAHIQYERFFHILKFNYENRDFNMTYVDDSTCYGRSWEDVTPFSDFLGDTSGEFYTNAQIWDMFEPHKVSVPYIFESLDLYCTTVDWEATDDSSDSDDSDDGAAAESLIRTHTTHPEIVSTSSTPAGLTGATAAVIAVVPVAFIAVVIAIRREFTARAARAA